MIRQIKQEDAAGFLHMMTCLDYETKMMLLEPGERCTDVEKIKKMIQGHLDAGDFFDVVVEEGQIVGMLSAERGRYQRTKHSAYVVTGIRAGFCGKGTGTALFKKLDQWAKQFKVSRLELTVVTTNEPAIHLYTKSGFQREGTKKHTMIVDGDYVDEYCMAKIY